MRRAGAAVAALLAALSLGSCRGGGDADRYVLQVRGTAQVGRGANPETLTTGRHRLRVGQTVTVTRGSAVLGLPGDTSLELRAGRRDSTVRVGPQPTLVDGDALVVAGTDDALALRAGGATVDVKGGAARLRRAAGVTVAVYQGEATVESLGRRLAAPLKALRQVTVSDTGAVPRRAVPLVYDRNDPDPWDTRYLNDAIDLGSQLERRVRVLNAREAPPAVDAAYLESVVPALRAAEGFRPDLVRASRSAGETIVGASIALGGSGRLASRWTKTFAFREAGADWGLVALDQRARRATVLGVLNGVIDRVVATISPAGVTGSVTPTSGGVGRGAPRGSTPTTAPPRGGTNPLLPSAPSAPSLPPITVPLLPSPTPSPTPSPPSPPVVPDPAPLIRPVTGLLDDLLGGGVGTGGSSPGNQPTSVVGGVLDTVRGLLEFRGRPTDAGRGAVPSPGWPMSSRSALTTSPASSSPLPSAGSTSTRFVPSWHR